MKITYIYIVAFTAALCIASCSQKDDTPAQRAAAKQILLLGNGVEPESLDPHITTGIPEAQIQQALFEGLVSKHGKSLDIQPGVASHWDVSSDGKVYTFHLRKDARWSNGDFVNAQDFVWSWRRLLLASLASEYVYMLFSVVNAEAFHRGQVGFEDVGIKAENDYMLKVTLDYPVPYFLQLLDHHSLFPVHKATIEAHGALDDRGNTWARVENFVGNGAFTLQSWRLNTHIKVLKNQHYWDAQAIKLNEIHFLPIENISTQEKMFRAGQLHIVEQLPSEKVPVYRKAKSPALRNYPYFATYFYRFNTRIKPLDDVNVRKALSYSVDRELLTDKVTRGGQKAAFSLVPPNTLGYESSAHFDYNPQLAQRLLSDAGYPNGQGFPRLTLIYNTLEYHKKVALAIQQMWKVTLNIDIQLQNQDWKVFLSNQSQGYFELARASWIGDYYDPTNFLEVFLSDSGNNHTGWKNQVYDTHINNAAHLINHTQRMNELSRAETLLMDDMPIIPLYYYNRTMLVSEKLKNWHNNELNHFNYKNIYFSKN